MITLVRRLFRWPWAAFTAVAMALVTWPAVKPVIVQRELVFGLALENAGSQWSVDWHRARDGYRNGRWVDAAQLVGSPETPSTSMPVSIVTPVVIRQTLPSYRVSTLRLAWRDSRDAFAELHAPRLELLFGPWCVETRPLACTVTDTAVLEHVAGDVTRIRTVAAEGELLFTGPTNFGLTANTLGFVATWLVLLFVVAGLNLATCIHWPGVWQAITAERVALLVVICANGFIAWWAPFLVTQDGAEYILNANRLLESGSVAEFQPPWRSPGLSVVMLPFIALFDDYGRWFSWFQAGLNVLVAWLGRGVLRHFAGRPWSAIGMLVIGLNPALHVYARYALTELMSAFFVTLVAGLLVWRATRSHRPSAWLELLGTASIAVACAAAAYVRGNLVTLVILAPIALVMGDWSRGRRLWGMAHGALLFVLAGAALLPWVLRNERIYGYRTFTPGEQMARIVAAWDHGTVDVNQTAVFSFEQWRRLKARHERKPLTRFELSASLVEAAGDGGDEAGTGAAERNVSVLAFDEAVSRSPQSHLARIGRSLLSQVGFARKLGMRGAAEDWLWSGPLRGEPSTPTNMVMWDGGAHTRGALGELLARSTREIGYLRAGAAPRWFNDLWHAYDLLQPALAILAAVGTIVAALQRRGLLLGIGLLAWANIGAISILLGTLIDRYSVPFRPLLVVLAIALIAQVFQPAAKRDSKARGHLTGCPFGE